MHKDKGKANTMAFKIPKVRYNLKSHDKKDKKTPVLIIGVFRYEGKRLLYTTKRHVPPKFWKGKERECQESLKDGGFQEGFEINEELKELARLIRNTYKDKFLNKNISPSTLRNELDYILGRQSRPQPKGKEHKTFIEFINFEVEKHKVAVNGKRGGQTWQKYESLLKRLQKFHSETGYTLEYDSVNETFKDELIFWLEKKKLSQNTISKDIETLKALLKRSRRHHTNNYYNDPDFKLNRIKTTKHYPTLHELKYLMKFQFEDKTIQQVVDLFLISAFGGGLRISDILSLTSENETTIDGVQVLQVFTYKNRNSKADNEVVIPFTPQLRILIDKYNWKLPKFTEQHINRTLKEAFEIAGLGRVEQIKSGVKGESTESKRLYEVVHFHCARYAYIDYMMNDLEVSAERLRKITGQSLKVLLGYERGNKKKNAKAVADSINRKLSFDIIKNDAV